MASGTDQATTLPAGWDAAVSPDRKSVYARFFGEAVIADLSQPMSKPLPMRIDGGAIGSWADERTYIAPIAGDRLGLEVISVEGTAKPMELSDNTVNIRKVVAAGERIYTLGMDHQLKSFDRNGASAKLLRSGVVDFAVSRNGERLAVSVQTAPNQEALFVTDTAARGTEKYVTKGRLVRQLSWSPDGDKLAYAAFSLEPSGSGLYVMQAQSGSAIALSVMPNAKQPIVWNPEGDALFVAEHDLTGMSAGFTTVYKLKKS